MILNKKHNTTHAWIQLNKSICTWGFLYEAINDYRKAIRKDSTLIDCYSDQLNSSINVAEVENLISKEQADRLRARYF